MARTYNKHYASYRYYDVYYRGRFLSSTYAPSPEKAINNVAFTSDRLCDDRYGFEAVPQKPKKPVITHHKASEPEEGRAEINLDYFINKKKKEQKPVPHWEQLSLFGTDGGGDAYGSSD